MRQCWAFALKTWLDPSDANAKLFRATIPALLEVSPPCGERLLNAYADYVATIMDAEASNRPELFDMNPFKELPALFEAARKEARKPPRFSGAADNSVSHAKRIKALRLAGQGKTRF